MDKIVEKADDLKIINKIKCIINKYFVYTTLYMKYLHWKSTLHYKNTIIYKKI